ncbi:MAG: iron ABC transporter permease [Anaerolineae bacterium SG8_19]|nr:MAG: iron ABC transporter permease [Anaerolineae bacterium SG8_19]
MAIHILHPRIGRLMLAATLIGALCALPVASVFINLFAESTPGVWGHLAGTVLPQYIANTLWLMIGVGGGVIALGVSTAWLTAMYDFPGRRLFDWALILPLAMPAYVIAFLYTDFLQFVGPVQTGLREFMGWTKADYWFPDVRSLGGAITMFILVLYPYVYLLSRAAFLERSASLLEVSRTLGVGGAGVFFRVALPLARPAIVAGTALALMEAIADFGTVSYFGVQTFTTGIYQAWFSMGERVVAAQLAAALLGFVVLVLLLERTSRGRKRFHETSQRGRPPARRRLEGGRAAGATALCFSALALGFLLPGGLLLEMAIGDGDAQFGSRFIQLTLNSVTLAAITAGLLVVLAVLMAYNARLNPGMISVGLSRLVGLGYAIPGLVIAVGTLIPLAWLDNALAGWLRSAFGISPGLLLTGGITALVFAYVVRFFSIGLQTVDAALLKIRPSMDDAARSLGCGPAETLRRIHVPILSRGLFTAMLLIFVEVMKELPATLVMRPFNFDTLATQVYNLAHDERLSEAATAALVIVAAGLIPLIVVSRGIARTRRASAVQVVPFEEAAVTGAR